jgi:hypothetical protein
MSVMAPTMVAKVVMATRVVAMAVLLDYRWGI